MWPYCSRVLSDTRFSVPSPMLFFHTGNAGFETANHIVGNAAYIHMAARYGVTLYIPLGISMFMHGMFLCVCTITGAVLSWPTRLTM